MGSLLRLLLGLPAAAVVTSGLFLFMWSMISGDVRLEEEKASVSIDITAQIEDTQLDARKEFKRPTLDTPPPPPPATSDPSNRPALDGVRAEVPQIEANLSIGSGFNPDRDAQPLVRIPPQFPDRCQGRAKSEERVVVEFDVTPEGAVTNERIIDSSNSCFNRAASRSVSRWKYQPKIVDNKAEWRRGVQTVITFRLAEE